MVVGYYLFICSDAETINGQKCAKDIAFVRLNKGLWPLYKGTRNRKSIGIGDACLFYLAGKCEGAQQIVATANIDTVEKWGMAKERIDNEDVLSDVPEQVIHLSNVKQIRPVHIKACLDELSFIPKARSHSWGGALQGGCKKLTEEDYKVLSGG